MANHFHRQLESLREMILKLGGLVEDSVVRAMEAVENRDVGLADKVIFGDAVIDQMEVDIEEECLHVLALYQPVAMDLRYVTSVLKINNDLERIADLAVNIAQQADFLSKEQQVPLPPEISDEARRVVRMLKISLDSLVRLDANMAEQVRRMDDAVDEIHRRMYQLVRQNIREQPDFVEQYIHILNVSRNLERVADHAVNIAEDVLYTVRGEIHRHTGDKRA